MTESRGEGGETGARSGSNAAPSAQDSIRQAFSALPFDQKFSTLIKIELDMLGDVVDTVVSAASQAVDDLARCCEYTEGSDSAQPGPGGHATTS